MPDPSKEKRIKKHAARAVEIDILRGVAVLIMLFYHFAFDLRYVFELDVWAFQEHFFWLKIVRAVIVILFVMMAGISCTLSRSNLRRGLKLLVVALLVTAVSVILSRIFQQEFFIFFNVLHLLAVATLGYALLTFRERRESLADAAQREQLYTRHTLQLMVLGALTLWLGSILPGPGAVSGLWFLPLGLLPARVPGMLDYLPLIPWLGFFWIGAAIGRLYYQDRQSRWTNLPRLLGQLLRPLGFLGRHALTIYLVHQPIFLLLLVLWFWAGAK